MEIIAVIGTRTPSEKQVQFVKAFVDGLAPTVKIVSGCARGIDTIALQRAKARGLSTRCYIPWEQKFSFADEIVILSRLPAILRQESEAFVRETHLAKGMDKVSFVYHQRNYLIIREASAVIAFPSTKKRGFGGTGFGILAAGKLGRPIRVIDENGEELKNVLSLLR